MKYILALCCLFIGMNVASAFDGLSVYTASLSKGDHFNSKGQKLNTARAILRQDRANYCKRRGLKNAGAADAEFFCDASKRNMFNNADITMSSRTARGIATGKIRTVCVIVLTRYSMKVSPGTCPDV